MEWVDELRGQLVALDTAPLIYFIEEHPAYCPVVAPFFEQLDNGLLRAATSVFRCGRSLRGISGPDSSEYEMVGRTRANERKKPKRKDKLTG